MACYKSAMDSYTNYYSSLLNEMQGVKRPLIDGTNPVLPLNNIERYNKMTRVDELQNF